MRRTNWWSRIVFSVAAFAAAVAGREVRAEVDPVGPPIGNVAYTAAISDAQDQDEYAAAFLSGETFTATVTALKVGRSAPTLKPLVEVVDPSGAATTFGSVTSRTGLSVTFRNYLTDEPGVWAVRVRGADGTTGPYSVRFSSKTRRADLHKANRLGGSAPYQRTYTFGAFSGATVTAKAKWKRGSSPVSFLAVNAPDGGGIVLSNGQSVATLATTRGNTTQLSNLTLNSGTGNYGLVMKVGSGSATYDLTIDVRAPKRAASRRTARLPDAEPFLDPLVYPLAAAAGDVIRITGRNFATVGTPTVRFGGSRSTQVTVGGGGTWIDCVVPPREGPLYVPVYVINPDGQGTARDAYFAYQPPPVIGDLVDAVSGDPVRGAATTGGRAVRLLGTNFDSVYALRVGGVLVTSKTTTETSYAFNLPALPAGSHRVTITDGFQRDAVSAFEVRAKVAPSLTANPYSPGAVRVQVATRVTVSGANFLDTDTVLFNGTAAATTLVGPGTRTVDVPAMPAGLYSFAIVDEVGTVVNGPVLAVKGPGIVNSVGVVAGAYVGTRDIAAGGGATIRVDGASFAPSDAVTLGGTAVTTFVTNTGTRKEFLAPAGAVGPADLSILDGALQQTIVFSAVNYVRFGDDTPARHPVVTAADDFGAKRVVVADLDRDGEADDLVITSNGNNSIGTRQKKTRVLIGSAAGTFTDTTDSSTAIPAPSGSDQWTADCLAVGDLDLTNGADIVLGGKIGGGTSGAQVRLLKNGGAGTFTVSASAFPGERTTAAMPSYNVYRSRWGYNYARQNTRPVFTAMAQEGSPQGLALGDIDRDGDLDAVMGTDHFQSRTVYYDPSRVVYQGAYVLPSYYYRIVASVLPADRVNYRQYTSALRVFRNDRGTAPTMTDVSSTRVPSPGNSKNGPPTVAAMHCKDLALGDLDVDGDLDLVVTWNDPSTVTAYGLSTKEATGTSKAAPTSATRILLNDGLGGFTNDATATWMPAGSNPELWQADRVALADLDGDGDPEVILLLANAVDAWKGTPTKTRRCLRILRNDRNRLVDVSSTALPLVSSADLDDFRGDALLVRDVNSDGNLDILVASTQAIVSGGGVRQPGFRTFFGRGSMTWIAGPAFSVGTGTDTGEASDIAVSTTLDSGNEPVFIFANQTAPTVSPSGRKLRTEKWKR